MPRFGVPEAMRISVSPVRPDNIAEAGGMARGSRHHSDAPCRSARNLDCSCLSDNRITLT